MKKVKVYLVSVFALVIVTAVGGFFLGPRFRGLDPMYSQLFTTYRLRFPPAHRVIDNPEYLNDGLDVVVWEHVGASEDGKPTISIAFLHDATGTQKEQTAMLEFLLAAGNLNETGPYVVVWFWIHYPDNNFHGIVCPPGLQNPCQQLPGTYTINSESWQELVVIPGWVRR